MAEPDVREDAQEFTQDILGCARCHGDGHKGLTFRKLTHPVEHYVPNGVADGDNYIVATHWAMCPTNGEPIMMGFFDAPTD